MMEPCPKCHKMGRSISYNYITISTCEDVKCGYDKWWDKNGKELHFTETRMNVAIEKWGYE